MEKDKKIMMIINLLKYIFKEHGCEGNNFSLVLLHSITHISSSFIPTIVIWDHVDCNERHVSHIDKLLDIVPHAAFLLSYLYFQLGSKKVHLLFFVGHLFFWPICF